jgi:hypothetical protein
VGELPDPAHRQLDDAGPPPGRAARRRRAHRPLLGRLRHEDGDGGCGRGGARALRASGRPRGRVRRI